MVDRLLIPLGLAIIAVGILIVLGGVILAALSPNSKTEAEVILFSSSPLLNYNASSKEDY